MALPCPVFEGSEKRIEVSFFRGAATPANSLRSLNRQQLDGLLELAACCIVSVRSNEQFDSYVLSESSLFVYPTKVVLKTCGTTKLLSCIPHLLELAAAIDMAPRSCKYSRAAFLFPEQQPAPHTSFDEEVCFLRNHFGHLGNGGSAYVLGDALNGLQWHIYTADADALTSGASRLSSYTLEVCMTDLDREKAAQFVRDGSFISSADTTTATGIRDLAPGADIDDYVFDPCGYSMNGIEEGGFITIHITPEDGFSYASVEFCDYPLEGVDLSRAVQRISEIFLPGEMSVLLSVDTNRSYTVWGDLLACPKGYTSQSTCVQDLGIHHAAYYTCRRTKQGEGALVRKDSQPNSPRTVLRSLHSFGSLPLPSPADSSYEGTSDSGAEGGSSMGDSVCEDSKKGVEEQVMHSPVSRTESAECLADTPTPSGPPSCEFGEGLSAVLAKVGAKPIPSAAASDVDAHVAKMIASGGLEDTFYVLDLGVVARLYAAWRAVMPRVDPFYAVKCNTDRAMIASLAALGAGFDCASQAEVDFVLGLGVSADRIVYANACKRPRDLRHAAVQGVQLTTFDSISELAKLARWHPHARTLLRIRADDPAARCQLGNKFGAEPERANELLTAAKELGVSVVGVAFHVGSGAENPEAYRQGIALAKKAFDAGSALGFDMHVLDIGGGFAGGEITAEGVCNLEPVAHVVNASLAEHFPEDTGVRVIAEPGRYFAESCATLACMVYGQREHPQSDGSVRRDYYITDGLYGSMNCIMYDHAKLSVRPLRSPLPQTFGPASSMVFNNCNGTASLTESVVSDKSGEEGWVVVDDQEEVAVSNVFGPTCDGLDRVLADAPLPLLRNGDWLLFPRMGAYALAGASNFNGFNATDVDIHYVYS